MSKCKLFDICNHKTFQCEYEEPNESCFFFNYFKDIINLKEKEKEILRIGEYWEQMEIDTDEIK